MPFARFDYLAAYSRLHCAVGQDSYSLFKKYLLLGMSRLCNCLHGADADAAGQPTYYHLLDIPRAVR